MPITPEQREERRMYIGASDVAALFNLDPYKSAWDVWAEKTNKLQDKPEAENYQAAGNAFEPAVIDWAEGQIGAILRNVVERCSIAGVPLVSHLDGKHVETQAPVEAKTAGLFGPLQEKYGEENTDELPYRIIIQASAQMICVGNGMDQAFVPCFLGGRGFVMYNVGVPDPDIFKMIIERVGTFWDNCVIKDTPPEDSEPSLAVVKRIIRDPKTITTVDTDLVEEWRDTREQRLAYEKAEKQLQARILAQMETAEGGQCDIGMVTYLEQCRRSVDTKRLKAERPEIHREFLKETVYRVMRFKGKK